MGGSHDAIPLLCIKAFETRFFERGNFFELRVPVFPRDGQGTEVKTGLEAGKGGRVRVLVKGTEAVVFVSDKEVARVAVPAGSGALGLKDTGAGMDFGNLHVRNL